MKKFKKKFEQNIVEIYSCFDRVLFKGHLPISGAACMSTFMKKRGVLLKDFSRFVKEPAQVLKEHAKSLAKRNNRPYLYLNSKQIRKEELARQIAKDEDIKEGLVCVFSITEGCLSFRLKYGKGAPRLENSKRKCLCIYYYFIDPEVGLFHIRIQTWFPFTIQFCVNGHELLKKKMQKEGLSFTTQDNCFTWVEDIARLQSFADSFIRYPWVEWLSFYARKVNPLLNDFLSAMQYYWVCDQVEYSTNVIFNKSAEFEPLYEKFLEHAVLRFGAKDILKFLGKRLDGRFKGAQVSVGRLRAECSRVRHWYKNNWIKMYSKNGVVLRVETVINHPYDFLIYRCGIRKGKKVKGWFPMSKHVGNLYRYRQICRTANFRYLDALAVQDSPHPSQKELQNLVNPLKYGKKKIGGFNPAKETDLTLFAEIMRAEYLVRGFTNADIRRALFKETCGCERRYSARVTRLFKKLHLRQLIAKIPRSHRWRVTPKGMRILGAILYFFNHEYVNMTAA